VKPRSKAKAADTTSTESKASKYPASRLAGLKPVQPGQVLNPAGRPKGSRNKLGEDFIAALAADFETHGIATIAKVRKEKPHEYVKVVAGILPKEMNIRATAVEELSDDELAAGIAALQSILAAQPLPDGSEKKTRH